MNSIPTEKATLAAGCFWGVENLFQKLPGVISTRVGYTGGRSFNPTYEEVCTDKTGHAEAVEIIFNPQIISYAELLDIFWQNHNPTTLNRQGPDIGSQYRSVIYYHTPEQADTAKAKKQALDESGRYKQPVVTQIVPADIFYPAEEYHQNYFNKHGGSHCQF